MMVVRHRDKQTSDQPLKKAIMRLLNELLLYGTYCTVLRVRYCTVLYFTLSLSLPPPPSHAPPPPLPVPVHVLVLRSEKDKAVKRLRGAEKQI